MKSSEIKELATPELEERISEEKILLTKLKLNHAVSPLDNPNRIVVTRKVIARLKTELRKRQLSEKTNS
ncbi:MAG: 50S ribosomal protein L29 [Bacteroidales bacterium]|nr:50S ribosomal protein L29 [Bacteroidales bacterium]